MKPILKWAGGKFDIVETICSVLPKKIRTYYEPFVGGAAVFFRLAELGRFDRACLSDVNQDLIDAYSSVRDYPELVIDELRRLTRKPISELDYYRLRRSNPRDPALRAARLIVLNKTGYRGLYRVNKSGRNNVPFGHYKNPSIFDEGHLRACSELLHGVTLIQDHYLWSFCAAEPGDAVYCDPPYLPIEGAKPGTGFRNYSPTGFGDEQHILLARNMTYLTKRGIHWVLSNSNSELSRRLFVARGTKVLEVDTRHKIANSKKTKGYLKELLVWQKPRLAA